MKLTFIYNANSGKINTWMDIGHKLISPDTYSCNLCSLTHGVFTEREEWKRYRESSDIELVFLHKNEFEKLYQGDSHFSYPIILKQDEDGGYQVFLSTEEINALNGIEELLALLPKSA